MNAHMVSSRPDPVRMRFGIQPIQWGTHFEQTLDECLLAEELGFRSVWISEHHGRELGYYPSPLMVLAALATRTRSVLLGANVVLLPLYHPVRVAEEGALVDVISQGRLVLGVALGYRREEFELFGVPMGERASRLEEGIEIITRLWAEDTVTHAGRHFRFTEGSVFPKPIQRPRPPIWIGGWVDQAVRRAARLGDAWFPGPTATWEKLAHCYRVYREALAPTRGAMQEVPLIREVFVAETQAEADHAGGVHLARMYQEDYVAWGHATVAGTSPSQGRFIVGDPVTCVQAIRQHREAFGITHFIARMHAPGMAPNAVERSMRLFAQHVMPAFAA